MAERGDQNTSIDDRLTALEGDLADLRAQLKKRHETFAGLVIDTAQALVTAAEKTVREVDEAVDRRLRLVQGVGQ